MLEPYGCAGRDATIRPRLTTRQALPLRFRGKGCGSESEEAAHRRAFLRHARVERAGAPGAAATSPRIAAGGSAAPTAAVLSTSTSTTRSSTCIAACPLAGGLIDGFVVRDVRGGVALATRGVLIECGGSGDGGGAPLSLGGSWSCNLTAVWDGVEQNPTKARRPRSGPRRERWRCDLRCRSSTRGYSPSEARVRLALNAVRYTVQW
jgi:hypothetical protein